MRTNWILRAVLCVAVPAAAPLLAQPYSIDTPTAQYTSLTTLIPIGTPNFTATSTLSGGGQTLTFAPSLIGFSGIVWGAPPNTEGTPSRFLLTDIGITAVTITLSSPSNTFGFEIEPNSAVGTHTIQATFYNGATPIATVTRTLPYNGARLMAVSHTTPITSVQISGPTSGGLAFAQFRFGNAIVGAPAAAVPALGLPELGALGLMLAAAGALLARRWQPAA